MSPSIQYASFLIRLWREERTDPARMPVDWHSEIEHIQTGDRWEFDTLEGLLSFLRREAEEGGKGGDPERPAGG
jgi:hypothetical protein